LQQAQQGSVCGVQQGDHGLDIVLTTQTLRGTYGAKGGVVCATEQTDRQTDGWHIQSECKTIVVVNNGVALD